MLRATTTFHVAQRTVQVGDIVRRDDPIVAGREHLFEDLSRYDDAPIEQATASPGERRAVKRPAKKAAAQPED